MGNPNYRKGAAFERAWMKAQEAKGIHIAVRTAGSHSPFDVILIPIDEERDLPVIVCQLKRGKKHVPKPPESFRKLPVGLNVVKWWVTKIDRQKANIELV